MPHRKWRHAMTQSQIEGNATYRPPISQSDLATAIAGNGNHTKSAKDFQAWFRLQQTRGGWADGKPYTMGPQGGGGWTVNWTGAGVVMNTSA